MTDVPIPWSALDPTVDYYDSDHPACGEPGSDDGWSRMIGWGQDESVYASYAEKACGPVLELCAGSGRISVRMAKVASHVTCVDASEPMLSALRKRISVAKCVNVSVERQDITRLALPGSFALAVMAYNSFPLFASLDAQMSVLSAVRKHLGARGMLVLDCDNAHHISPMGRPPSFAFNRRHLVRGIAYSKWIGVGPMAADQRVNVFGWYDEIMESSGCVRRRPWSSDQRAVYPSELKLMCQLAGYRDITLRGVFPGFPFSAQSSRFLIEAAV